MSTLHQPLDTAPIHRKDVSSEVDVDVDVDTFAAKNPIPRRIPMSGLKLCGRRWLCGAEDLCIPAFFATLFSSSMFALVIATLALTYTQDIPSICLDIKHFRIVLYAHVAAWGAATLNDIAIVISSLRTNMFRPNRWIVRWLYLRAVVAAVLVTVIILYTILYVNAFTNTGCVVPPEQMTSSATVLHRMCIMLLCMFWIMIAFGSCTLTCTWGCGQCCITAHRHALWVNRLRCIFCCFDVPVALQTHRDVLSTVATIMGNLFKNEEKLHITPSDLIVGLFLVESSQRLRKKKGRKFRFAASHRRWEPPHVAVSQMIHSPEPYQPAVVDESWWPVGKSPFASIHARTPTSTTSSLPGNGNGNTIPNSSRVLSPAPVAVAVAIAVANRNSATSTTLSTGTSSVDLRIDIPSSPSPSPSPSSSPHDAIATVSDDNPEGDLAAIAESGVQPKLQPQDWQRIAEAYYYTKYIQASYGAIVYTVDRTCKACCMGHLCIPCRHSNKYKTEHFVGSGCGVGCYPNRCCHWSINAFMRFANVKREDIIYARLHDAPIYYVVIDRESRRLVITCRGTNSVTDCIIDIDARLTSLDHLGFKNSYAHQGMYENAVRCRDDIISVGIVKQFMDANPDYKIVCVGHSLGGATALLLTLLLREEYSSRGLRCIILASPLLLDAATANHPWIMERVTTINYHNDFVSRASLANVFQLKKQIQCAFTVSTSNKFKVLSASLRRRFSKAFEEGHDDDAYDLYKRIKEKDIQEEQRARLAAVVHGPTHAPPPPPTTDRELFITSPPSYASDNISPASPFTPLSSPSSSSFPSSSASVTPRDVRACSDFGQHLRRCYTPGRVYHMLPTKQKNKTGCCGPSPSPRPFRVIYPAAHETFQEMRISKSMFVEHFPINYWLTELDIPDEYLHDRVFDRP